ncbi:MAG: crossover junction endodeoxyribonuclease RuvC [Clostridia bacterium]|nr:crossover junction endodeoxyribonuclease RuvC [Clostridia bacterium]
MIILGVDPGIAICGTGVIEKTSVGYKPLYYDSIITKAHTPLENRIEIIYNEIVRLIDEYRPDALAAEELFFNNNAKTAFAVGQARGVILLAAKQKGVSFFEYTPLQVKQALTGYGRADKQQMQHMVKSFLGLSEVPRPDDTADALAIAICHGNSVKFNNLALRMKEGKI